MSSTDMYTLCIHETHLSILHACLKASNQYKDLPWQHDVISYIENMGQEMQLARAQPHNWLQVQLTCLVGYALS